jgi:hypothetical protein
LDVDYRICITWIIHQQLSGFKVAEKLYLGVREQKRLNTTGLDYWPALCIFVMVSPLVIFTRPPSVVLQYASLSKSFITAFLARPWYRRWKYMSGEHSPSLITGCKKEKVTGGWRKPRNESFGSVRFVENWTESLTICFKIFRTINFFLYFFHTLHDIEWYVKASCLGNRTSFYSLAVPDYLPIYLPIYLLITCLASKFGQVNVHTEHVTRSKILVHLPRVNRTLYVGKCGLTLETNNANSRSVV